jgi:Skp family chaperone for outer membrane proteins
MSIQNHRPLTAVLSLSLLLLGAVPALAQAPAPAEAPKPAVAPLPKARDVKVAVIDIEKTFNTLEERSQIQADLAVMVDKFSQESNVMNQEIKDLEEDLRVLDSNSPSFKVKEETLSKKAFEKQAWMTWRQNFMQREQKLKQLDLYKKINTATAELAKENGYDLVLFKEPPIENMARLNPQEQQDAMASRKLIFFAPDLEITDAVVTRMNNEYKNRKAPIKPAATPTR